MPTDPGPEPALSRQPELESRLRGGDEAALGEIFRRWAPAVYAAAHRILGDADAAEDVVGETFWQVWNQRERFDARRGTLASWVLLIGRSRALDARRTRKRRGELPHDPLRDATAADPPAPAEADERRRRVAEAVDSLPPEQSELLRLAYFGGLSHREISAQTDVPLGTVKSRIRLALRMLSTHLSALWEG